jgi:hypothetical protein
MSSSLARFTLLESKLLTEDLGEIVNTLSELRQEIIRTENPTLVSSVVFKGANRFENTKNIIKYQYLQVFQTVYC